jgi:hypothetical protein
MCGIRLQADYCRLEAGRHSFETTPEATPPFGRGLPDLPSPMFAIAQTADVRVR